MIFCVLRKGYSAENLSYPPGNKHVLLLSLLNTTPPPPPPHTHTHTHTQLNWAPFSIMTGFLLPLEARVVAQWTAGAAEKVQ